MATVEYRKVGSVDKTVVEIEEDESWRQALARHYDETYPVGKHEWYVALSEHFVGGSTWHVQMGYQLGRGGDSPTTLDDLIVVNVNEDK